MPYKRKLCAVFRENVQQYNESFGQNEDSSRTTVRPHSFISLEFHLETSTGTLKSIHERFVKSKKEIRTY